MAKFENNPDIFLLRMNRFRNLSMPKRNTTGLVQSSVKNEPSLKHNVRYKEGKGSEVIKQSLIMSGSSSGSGSAPNSARSGSSESSGYQSRKDVERLAGRSGFMGSSWCLEQAANWIQFLRDGGGGSSAAPV